MNTDKQLIITDAARDQVARLKERENKIHYFLKVSVVGGGCSGLSYKLGFVEKPSDDDQVLVENGVQAVMDPKSALFLKGMTLDFSDGLDGAGFVFSNPNAKKSCGCGTSFSV